MLPEPDYEKFSYDELIDVYENIDRVKYSERFEKIKCHLNKLATQSSQAEPESTKLERKLKLTEASVGVDGGWGFSFGGDGCSGGDGGD
jgi:hypothetical protein